MLILATTDQLEKKAMKKYNKVIISDMSDDLGVKKAIIAREFLPDPTLFMNYANGIISKKRYRKEYYNEIKQDEGKFTSLLTMMIIYRKGEPLCIACDRDEKQYLYLEYLADYISDRYGIKIGTYKDVKEKGDKIKNKIGDEKRLQKDIKEYREELENILGKVDKKRKNKDKKKSKKKDSKKDKKKKKDKDYGKKYEEKKVRRVIEDTALYESGYAERYGENNLVVGSDIELVDSKITKRLFRNR